MKMAAVGIAAAVLLFSTSCTKEANSPNGATDIETRSLTTTPIADKRDQQKIDDAVKRIPGIAVYNTVMDKYILLDLSESNQRKFDFSSPGGGVVFTSPDGTVEFVEGANGAYYQVVDPQASSGGGGGLLSAGDVTLNINYVICFSTGDDAFDVDLFGVGAGFDGFSGAIGIAGDLEGLMNGEIDEDTDPFDFFQGFVAFYIFDGSPDGEYDVLDFFDAETGEFDLDGLALAYFLSFQDGEAGIFFGIDGALDFNGGSVAFNGTYWGLTDIFIDFGGQGEDPEEPEYVEVEGSGTLNCQ